MNDRLLSRVACVLLLGLAFLSWGSSPGTAIGADGTWNVTTSGNWSDTANWTAGTVAGGSGATAWFNAVDVPAGGITVALDVSPTVGHLVFADTGTATVGGWILSDANLLTLAGAAPTITVDALGTDSIVTIAAVITGSNGLTKAGAGTLLLTGANTYTGGTIIGPSSGILAATLNATQNALGTGSIAIGTGATLLYNNTNTSGDPTAVTVNNPITGDGRLIMNFTTGGNARNTYIRGLSGFTGTIELTKAGAATTADKWNLSGAGTMDAAVVVNSGTQLFAAADTTFLRGITISGIGNSEGRGAIRLGATLNGNMTLIGDTTIGQEGGTLAGSITSGTAGTQILTFAGAVAGSSTVSGSITDGVGVLAITQNRADGTLTLTGGNTYSGMTTISAGTLRIGSGGTTGTLGSGNVVNNAALVFNRSNDLTVANVISGSGTLEKQGAGILTLTGANAYGGATTISGGTLQVGAGGTTGTLGAGAVTNNAALAFYRADAADLDIGRTITGTGSVTYRGTGVIEQSRYLVDESNSYSGGTTISQARVAMRHNNAFGTGALNVLSGGQVFLSAADVELSNPITIAGNGWSEGAGVLGAIRLSSNGVVSGPVTLAANSRVTAYSSGDSGTISGGISGNYAIEKTGAGTVIFSGDNSYATTTISAGTLRVGAGGTTGTLGSGNVVNNGLLVFNRSNDLTVANTISGSGGIVKQGSGTLTFTGTKLYGGSTHIEAGTLRLVGPAHQNPVTAGLSWSLDASDAASINGGSAAGGDAVATWTASVGTTVSQSDTAKQPTYLTGAQNGLSVIRFDGVDDRLFSGTSYAAAKTMFVVNNPIGTQKSLAGLVGGTGDAGTTSDKGIRASGGTAWQNPGDGNDFTNPAGSQMRVNSLAANSFAGLGFHLLAATRNTDAMRFNAVGSYLNGYPREFGGDVGEILAFDRVLTGDEISAVEAYLYWKWFGASDVLPSGTAVTIDAGAQLSLVDITQSIGSLTGAAGSSVALDNSVLEVGGNNASTTFAGSMSGDGGLTKTGAGTFTLSGANE
ncbi:MAG: autotransporter-associated beta strand repeat-containing protein, partial [Patescibacteria group bacterium]|nr:autotransporter-associated beta strand repeat-containing protein [Patescibacteria group bacterium]